VCALCLITSALAFAFPPLYCIKIQHDFKWVGVKINVSCNMIKLDFWPPVEKWFPSAWFYTGKKRLIEKNSDACRGRSPDYPLPSFLLTYLLDGENALCRAWRKADTCFQHLLSSCHSSSSAVTELRVQRRRYHAYSFTCGNSSLYERKSHTTPRYTGWSEKKQSPPRTEFVYF